MSDIYDRMKNLREYTVVRDIPDGFMLSGKMPYDLTMTESEIKIIVWAVSQQEADERAEQFIERCTQ